jgi:hypothetical protein
LTPPRWQQIYDPKWRVIQAQLWAAFTNMVDKLKPIDILFVNGDEVDGKGKRSGGTELISTDRSVQAEMAAFCIQQGLSQDLKNTIFIQNRIGGIDYPSKVFLVRSEN